MANGKKKKTEPKVEKKEPKLGKYGQPIVGKKFGVELK